MKISILSLIFIAFSVCCNAQFKLTPTAGLITEDGAYIIKRSTTEDENYEAAKEAVMKVIPNAEIGEMEEELSFIVNSEFKDRCKIIALYALPLDCTFEYKLKIEAKDEAIYISFVEIGPFILWNKGKVHLCCNPTTGKNSSLFSPVPKRTRYLFNSKGKSAAVYGKTIVEYYENFANELVKNIETNL